jgi:hypothetical protein
VLGALPHDGKLHWKTQQLPTVRDDAIGFLGALVEQAPAGRNIVVFNYTSFHKTKPLDKCRQK